MCETGEPTRHGKVFSDDLSKATKTFSVLLVTHVSELNLGHDGEIGSNSTGRTPAQKVESAHGRPLRRFDRTKEKIPPHLLFIISFLQNEEDSLEGQTSESSGKT